MVFVRGQNGSSGIKLRRATLADHIFTIYKVNRMAKILETVHIWDGGGGGR